MPLSYVNRTCQRLPPLLGARSLEAAHRVVDLVNAHPALWPLLEELTRRPHGDWPHTTDWPHVLHCVENHVKRRNNR